MRQRSGEENEKEGRVIENMIKPKYGISATVGPLASQPELQSIHNHYGVCQGELEV